MIWWAEYDRDCFTSILYGEILRVTQIDLDYGIGAEDSAAATLMPLDKFTSSQEWQINFSQSKEINFMLMT